MRNTPDDFDDANTILNMSLLKFYIKIVENFFVHNCNFNKY